MKETTLCIQGPPGTGKTYTGARIILDLIRQGKRIGITANGHKAINNLLEQIVLANFGVKIALKGIKVNSQDEEELIQKTGFAHIDGGKKLYALGIEKFNLIGATAWTFSRPEAAETLDYLFVDEAGQVSVANLTGMARSTKNIVLMGDQMQLEQPIQGSHPDESGESCLNYLLQEHATIPPEMGIFLGVTRRMHPNVCKFISDSIYEGRLTSHPDTQNQVLILPNHKEGLIRTTSGIQFIPVAHEGNVQASDEEVDVIEKLVKELLECQVVDKAKKSRKLTWEDILFVAPYNLQVNRLQERLGSKAKVGSVDLFQGKEAAVVILSMCSSDGDSSPRGIEFLLNKNRINVAISRAMSLAIVVGNTQLTNAKCGTVEKLQLVNLFCKIILKYSE